MQGAKFWACSITLKGSEDDDNASPRGLSFFSSAVVTANGENRNENKTGIEVRDDCPLSLMHHFVDVGWKWE